MFWIIPWTLVGYTLFLLSDPGSWPQAKTSVSFELALHDRIMPPLFSTPVLHNNNNNNNNNSHLDYGRRPLHRGSGRMFTYNFTSPNSIPSIWSCRPPTSSLRHHNKLHVNLTNLRPLLQSSQPITKHRHLKLALLNTRSLNNKSLILNEFITDNNLDFLCLTETWHKPMDYFSLNQTTPTGFTYIDQPRPEGRGGGVAAVYRKDIKITSIPIPTAHSFEHLTFKLSGPTPLVTAIIYRPPKPNPSFLSDLSDFLTQLCAISPSVLLLGDFNFHIDDTDSKPAIEFLELLQCFNFTQHVNFPTHTRGHTLDLVCSTGLTLHQLSSLNLNISDHLAITMDIDIPIPIPKEKRKITFRNIKSISPSALSTSLTSTMSASPPPPSDNPSDLINYYNNTLSSCLDQLAPIKTKTVSFTHSAPWYTPELHQMKSRKRQLERLHKKTGLTVHLQALTDYLQQYKDALNTARSTYYSTLIHSGSTNPKALFSTVNKLLKPSDNTSASFTVNKCNAFLSFFQSKIDTIYSNLTTTPSTSTSPPASPPPFTTQPLSQFSPLSPTELPKIMAGKE